jgi:hypothetical protein
MPFDEQKHDAEARAATAGLVAEVCAYAAGLWLVFDVHTFNAITAGLILAAVLRLAGFVKHKKKK